MGITIRPCTLADIDQLQGLQVEMTGEKTPAGQALRAALATPNTEFAFVFAGSRLAGFTRLNLGDAQSEQLGPDHLEVASLYIRPAFRRQGLGRALLAHAAKAATAQGATRLWCGLSNPGAATLAFLTAGGFWPDATKWRFECAVGHPRLAPHPRVGTSSPSEAARRAFALRATAGFVLN
ncbi:GNAT family N-acetyltransferase [Lacticaseibacillus parakribbianus]|uniref:GNAT family N-acetyltransferase n=1 Tax=Lacticaseibacillus parakribbianus TaxID=2970927 RepID=UPI0021CB64DC|nr:GNAT family N-acetyltransferase [Lacticaseibacillus parakribbianus]